MDRTRSVSFDRIADSYDTTRGGLERGGGVAREIARHLRPGRVVEIGVGTAAVALPLVRLGHPVVGFDLSEPMLRRAHDRLGASVAVADAYHLPVTDGAAPNAVVVWVLQLVPDVTAFLAEARRVLAPGGRLAVVPAGAQREHDDIDAVLRPMLHTLRPPRDRPDQVIGAAEEVGLALVERLTRRNEVTWHQSPEDQARAVEARAWATLWDVPDDRWKAVVEPALAAVRALPEPARPRARRTTYELLVFTRS
jgi:SAM-dependent methyltransferase